MFVLRAIVLVALSSACHGFQGGSFLPSKLQLPKEVQENKNKPKPAALNHDFSSLVHSNTFGQNIPTTGTENDEQSVEKKIEEATEPLEQTIANLTKKNTQLKSQVRNLNDVVTDLKSKKAVQTGNCAAAMKKVKSLTVDLHKAEEMQKSVNQQLEEANQKVNLLISIYRKSKASVASLTENLTKTQDKAQTLKTELNKKKSEMQTLQRKFFEVQTQLGKAVKQLASTSNNQNKKLVMVDGCPKQFTNDKRAKICYGIVKDPFLTYNVAQTYCKDKYGGRLAVLNTSAKFIAVKNAVSKSGRRNSFWIGCHADRKGRMKWTDGKTVSRSFWAPGEPNNLREQCGDMHHALFFKMNDDYCDKPNLFVCEVVKN